MDKTFIYHNATLSKVVDADTLDFDLDLGFHINVKHRFRLAGINAPEIRGEERAYGLIAKNRVESLLWFNPVTRIITYKADSFGRWLADIYIKQKDETIESNIPRMVEVRLQDILLREGVAAPWDGKGKNPKPWLTEDYPLLVETDIHVSHPGH